MNFRPELAAAVMAGDKTVTRRLVSANVNSPWWEHECGYRVGQRVAICPGRGKPNIGHAIVMSVCREPLGRRLNSAEVRDEGFETYGGFVNAWTAINGSYDPEALVWRIGLQVAA